MKSTQFACFVDDMIIITKTFWTMAEVTAAANYYGANRKDDVPYRIAHRAINKLTWYTSSIAVGIVDRENIC